MKHLVVLAGFALVAFALYRALKVDPNAPEHVAPLPQPAAPGLNPSV